MTNLAEQVTAQETDQNVYRTHKSRIFEMIFSDRKELLQRYGGTAGGTAGCTGTATVGCIYGERRSVFPGAYGNDA